jgi:hypothetical protein
LRPCSGKLGAEVEALLAVRPPGGQLGTHREVTAPRGAAVPHGDLHLAGLRQPEEPAGGGVEPAQQLGRHTMADDVEEAAVPAGPLDVAGHLAQRRTGSPGQPGHIDNRQHAFSLTAWP